MAANPVGLDIGRPLTPEPYNGRDEYTPDMDEVLETPAKEIEQLFDKVEAYGETTLELAKLKSLEVATKVVTSLVSKLAVAIMFTMFLIVINIGASLYLGELMGKAYYGYFIVGVINLVFAILLHLFLQPVVNKTLGHMIIRQALD